MTELKSVLDVKNELIGDNIDYNFMHQVRTVTLANSVAPSAADLITAFGAAADNQGTMGLVRNSGGSLDRYFITCNGTDYYYRVMFKAP